MKKPKCKCGRVCAYYGKVGGFSVKCLACNAKHAKWQRDRRKALKDEVEETALFWMRHRLEMIEKENALLRTRPA